MIHIVECWNAAAHAKRLEQMFAMRARVFGRRLGWDVVCVDGQERDALDGASPVYVIATDEADRVVGSCRLLPSTGPTLLEACFSDTMPDAARLVDPTIWECTRFCIEQEGDDDCADGLGEVARSIVRAVVGMALRTGIATIIANVDVVTLRVCRRAGYRFDVLGRTDRYGSAVYLASFSISEAAEVVRGRDGAEPAVPARAAGARQLVDA